MRLLNNKITIKEISPLRLFNNKITIKKISPLKPLDK